MKRLFQGQLEGPALMLIRSECLPMIGMCKGSFDKIARVKVVFENGMSSKWITVRGDKNKVAITILTDVSIRNYITMNKQLFRLDGNYLREQKP